jgi:hypothetical protein
MSRVQQSLNGLAIIIILLICLGSCSNSTDSPSKGSLDITINGLPTGASADVIVTGPDEYSRVVTKSKMLSKLTPGNYTFAASGIIVWGLEYSPLQNSQTLMVGEDSVAIVSIDYASATESASIDHSNPPAGADIVLYGEQYRPLNRDNTDNVVVGEGDNFFFPGLGSNVLYVGPDGNVIALDPDSPDMDIMVFDLNNLIAYSGTDFSSSDCTIFGWKVGDQLHIDNCPSLTKVNAFTGTPYELMVDESLFDGNVVLILIDVDGDSMADAELTVWGKIGSNITADDIRI